MPKNIFNLLIFFASFRLFGMEANREIIDTIPDFPIALFSHKHQLAASLAKWIEKVPEGSKVYVANTFLTSHIIPSALFAAHDNGAQIHLIIDRDSYEKPETAAKTKEILENLIDIGINTYIYNLSQKMLTPYPKNAPRAQTMHLKMAFWKEVQAEDQPRYRVVSGTANLSHNAENHNWEHMTVIPDNKILYKKSKALFQETTHNSVLYSMIKDQEYKITNKSAAQKIALSKHVDKPTPPTSMLRSPRENPLLVINALIRSAATTSPIMISCYAINDFQLIDNLISAASKKTPLDIITDRVSCENKFALKDLDKLNAAVPFYVFNNKRGHNHHKFMICKTKDNRNWLIEGSFNFSYQAAYDINELTVHQNNDALTQAFIEAFHQTKAQCIPYNEYKKNQLDIDSLSGCINKWTIN